MDINGGQWKLGDMIVTAAHIAIIITVPEIPVLLAVGWAAYDAYKATR